MVGAGLTAFLGFAAVAVDLGNAWQEERGLHTATDAAALAGSLTEADGLDAAAGCDAAEAQFELNGYDAADAGTTLVCTVIYNGGNVGGTVSVVATVQVDYSFAPILGIDSGTVTSTSRAQWGLASYIDGGLRPLGVCYDSLLELIGPWDGLTPIFSLTIPYGKPDPQPNGDENCGTAPSNWGIIDFDADQNANSDIKEWIEHGYPGTVYSGSLVGNCDDGDVGFEPDACYEADPGAFSGSLADSLQTLVSRQIEFSIPLFDECSGNCHGANADFHIVGFSRIRLIGFKSTGAASSRYLLVDILPGPVDGPAAGNDVGFGAFAVNLCGFEGSNECNTSSSPSPTPTATATPTP